MLVMYILEALQTAALPCSFTRIKTLKQLSSSFSASPASSVTGDFPIPPASHCLPFRAESAPSPALLSSSLNIAPSSHILVSPLSSFSSLHPLPILSPFPVCPSFFSTWSYSSSKFRLSFSPSYHSLFAPSSTITLSEYSALSF